MKLQFAIRDNATTAQRSRLSTCKPITLAICTYGDNNFMMDFVDFGLYGVDFVDSGDPIFFIVAVA